MTPRRVERTYLTLTLLQTLAASLIWGINTLFLLDAGLSLTEAFVANAAFTAGMMVFEVPTGVLADAMGRQFSFILGAATLVVTTLFYLLLWHYRVEVGWWILASALIGLGFTFFSGATEAWLVDALVATGFKGNPETVFGKGQFAEGAAMLTGTISGGLLAQINLGLPFVVRSALLIVLIGVAASSMRDLGYAPQKTNSVRERIRTIVRGSIRHGLGNPPVRMFMFAAPFVTGVTFWVFYAFQPYLLELFGDPSARWLGGASAALFASAQMIGGASVKVARKLIATRTGIMITEAFSGAIALMGVGLAEWLRIPVGFWLALALLAVASLGLAITEPLQQAFINDVIPGEQRATVISFASLMGSTGGVVLQPALGRVADVYSIGVGYLAAGALFALRIPFLFAVRAMKLPADEPAKAESG